jgi:hypothetical protein
VKNVWTINCSGSVSCLFSDTYAACRKYIVGRWGHWPPFAIISQIETSEKFKRKYT